MNQKIKRRVVQKQRKIVKSIDRRKARRNSLADNSFAEILRPIRKDVRKKGITERELDEIIDRARHRKFITRFSKKRNARS